MAKKKESPKAAAPMVAGKKNVPAPQTSGKKVVAPSNAKKAPTTAAPVTNKKDSVATKPVAKAKAAPVQPATKAVTKTVAPSSKAPAKPVAPAAKPVAKPSAPAAKPATPAIKSVAKPGVAAAKPATPAAKPVAKPSAPAAKPATPAAKSVTKPAVAAAKPATPAAKSVSKPAVAAAKSATPSAKSASKPAVAAAKSGTPAAKPSLKNVEAKENSTNTPVEEKGKPIAPTAPATVGGRPKAVVKAPDIDRAAIAADRQAKIEADKAARLASVKALTDARLAKAAEVKANLAAKKAERAAKIEADAKIKEARAAAIREANAAKSANIVTVSKPAEKAQPAAKAVKPAASTAKAPVKSVAAPAFEVGLSLRLDPKWESVMQNALRDAAKVVLEQLDAQLKINPETDLKTRRILENDKRKLIKIIERAIGSAMTRLLEPADLAIVGLGLNAEGSRLTAPAKQLTPTAFAKAKAISTYKELLGLIAQPNSSLQQFGLSKPEILLNFGDSLADGYFLSGSFKLNFDFAKPALSSVEQHFHLFAKQGKSLGVQVKIQFRHTLAGEGYAGKLEVDFPVSKSEG
jgi:hypothetical protein